MNSYSDKKIWEVLRDIADRAERQEPQIENFALVCFSNRPVEKSLFCCAGPKYDDPNLFAVDWSYVVKHTFDHSKVIDTTMSSDWKQ